MEARDLLEEAYTQAKTFPRKRMTDENALHPLSRYVCLVYKITVNGQPDTGAGACSWLS